MSKNSQSPYTFKAEEQSNSSRPARVPIDLSDEASRRSISVLPGDRQSLSIPLETRQNMGGDSLSSNTKRRLSNNSQSPYIFKADEQSYSSRPAGVPTDLSDEAFRRSDIMHPEDRQCLSSRRSFLMHPEDRQSYSVPLETRQNMGGDNLSLITARRLSNNSQSPYRFKADEQSYSSRPAGIPTDLSDEAFRRSGTMYPEDRQSLSSRRSFLMHLEDRQSYSVPLETRQNMGGDNLSSITARRLSNNSQSPYRFKEDEQSYSRRPAGLPTDLSDEAFRRSGTMHPEDCQSHSYRRSFPMHPEDRQSLSSRRSCPMYPEDRQSLSSRRSCPMYPEDRQSLSSRRSCPMYPEDRQSLSSRRSFSLHPEDRQSYSVPLETRQNLGGDSLSSNTSRRLSNNSQSVYKFQTGEQSYSSLPAGVSTDLSDGAPRRLCSMQSEDCQRLSVVQDGRENSGSAGMSSDTIRRLSNHSQSPYRLKTEEQTSYSSRPVGLPTDLSDETSSTSLSMKPEDHLSLSVAQKTQQSLGGAIISSKISKRKLSGAQKRKFKKAKFEAAALEEASTRHELVKSAIQVEGDTSRSQVACQKQMTLPDSSAPSTKSTRYDDSNHLSSALIDHELKVAIIPVDYPLVQLNKKLGEEIVNNLLLKLDLLLEQEEIHPQFSGFSHNSGACILTCDNEESKTWLSAIVGDMTVGEGIGLRVGSMNDLSRVVKVGAYFHGPRVPNEIIMKRLMLQNPEVPEIAQWHILGIKEEPHGVFVILKIPETSLKKLEGIDNSMSYGLDKIHIKIFQKKKPQKNYSEDKQVSNYQKNKSFEERKGFTTSTINSPASSSSVGWEKWMKVTESTARGNANLGEVMHREVTVWGNPGSERLGASTSRGPALAEPAEVTEIFAYRAQGYPPRELDY